MLKFLFGVMLVGLTFFSLSAEELKLVEKWKWTPENKEIYSPIFSNDGKEIVLTLKYHVADGCEAEGKPESYFEEVKKKQEADPRFSDPEVTILKLPSFATEKIDWGWDPDISSDGKSIVYAFQKKPISGFRVLAVTLAGNEIVLFDREKKTRTVLASPKIKEFSFMAPSFSDDDKNVIYSMTTKVNGDWQGTVGVGMVELPAKKVSTILAPEKNFDLYAIIGGFFWNGKYLVIHRQIPLKAGTFLSDEYQNEILFWNNGSARKEIIRKTETMEKVIIENVQNDVLVADTKGLTFFDISKASKKETPSIKIDTTYIKNTAASPDGKWLVYVAYGEQNMMVLQSLTDPMQKYILVIPNEKFRGEREIQSISWAPDSKGILIVHTLTSDEMGFFQIENITKILPSLK